MIPTPADDRAAELNERIRALVEVGQAGSDEYQRLLGEWLRETVVQRTRDWIAAEEQHLAAEAHRRPPPPPPDWLIEHGIGTGRPAVRVHVGGCWDTRTRCKPATADVVRRALAEGTGTRSRSPRRR